MTPRHMAAMIRRRHLAAALLPLLAACVVPIPFTRDATSQAEPRRVVQPAPQRGPVPRGTAPLRAAMLAVHNEARRAVGVAPLTWDDTLVADARGYAAELAAGARFRHSEGRRGQGENLFTGTKGGYRYDEMAQLWVDERRDYANLPAPRGSRTGRWDDVAHYAQIVWRGTQRVGCAAATGAKDDVLVCRYSPPGNVAGQVAY